MHEIPELVDPVQEDSQVTQDQDTMESNPVEEMVPVDVDPAPMTEDAEEHRAESDSESDETSEPERELRRSNRRRSPMKRFGNPVCTTLQLNG